MTSTRHKICTIIFYFTILLLFTFLLSGCVRQPDAVHDAADAAHQQVVAIKDSIPKECISKANEEQIKALGKMIDSIVSNCETQKDMITAEKMKWMYAFFALLVIIMANILRKVIK